MTSGLYLTRGLHLVLYEQASLDDVWELKADGSLKDYSAWGTLYGGLAATDGGPTLAELIVTKSAYDLDGNLLAVAGKGYLRLELHRLLIEPLVAIDLGRDGRGSLDLFGADPAGIIKPIARGSWELVRASTQDEVFV